MDDLLRHLILTPEMLRLVVEIDEYKGKWQAFRELAPDRLAELRRVATIESVGSSTRIEGVRLNDAEVEALLEGRDVGSFRSRDEQEVAGYAAAMELVFESWREISLRENHLKQIHHFLLRHSEQDAHHRGKYKTLANNVEAFDAEGRSLGVVFATSSPFDTPRHMAALVEWTRAALEEGVHHPLLILAVFVVRFLAVHPFQDGNGRLSRVFTTLLLLRLGYTYVPYSSLERIVEENKSKYYRALRVAQSTLDRGEEHLGEWVTFLLRCLVRQKDALVSKVEAERQVAALPALSERILQLTRQQGRITLRGAVAATDTSRNTLKVYFSRLTAEGRLVRKGRGRGVWYEVAE